MMILLSHLFCSGSNSSTVCSLHLISYNQNQTQCYSVVSSVVTNAANHNKLKKEKKNNGRSSIAVRAKIILLTLKAYLSRVKTIPPTPS